MVTDNGFNVISSEELHSMFDREDLNYLEHVYGINGEWILARDKYLTARVNELERENEQPGLQNASLLAAMSDIY